MNELEIPGCLNHACPGAYYIRDLDDVIHTGLLLVSLSKRSKTWLDHAYLQDVVREMQQWTT